MPALRDRIIAVFIICFGTVGLGGCQKSATHADVTGPWKGTGHTINSRGRSHTSKVLVLEVDGNGLIEGTSGWELLEGPGGHDGDTPSIGSEERIIGTFVPSTGEIHLVETRENGQLHGVFLDERRIRMVLVQPGPKPVASAFVLTKVSDD